eukprot:m.261696 g.261696  ORF g.261696 m.261696 type:complete len:251 (+) comp42810_c0_seq1:149-901(+)
MGNCGSGGSRSQAPARERNLDPAAADIGDGKPLQLERWSSEIPLSPIEIEHRRKEFWDTAPAYEGRKEIWDALRAACNESNIGTAQAIVKGADITLPNGSLTSCFDASGAKYSVPLYCISYPENIVNQSQSSPSKATQPPTSPTPPSPTVSPSQSPTKPPVSPVGDELKVRCRLSVGVDEVLDFAVSACAVHIKERLFETKNIEISRQFIYFIGKEITNGVPISSLRLSKRDVLQILIVPKNNTSGDVEV